MAKRQVTTSLVGLQFGKWTVISRSIGERSGHGQWWHCRCECGGTSIVSSYNLKRAKPDMGCGTCRQTQGNQSRTREYKIWSKMLRRCYVQTNDNYRWYGALGTYVCQRWRESFLAFQEDMGNAPSPKHTLDRIDTHGNYTCGKCQECLDKDQPSNCRWATQYVQHRNAKNNRHYTHNGKTMILKDWARASGIKYLTLWNRLNNGVPFADAITLGRYDRKGITRSKEE